VRVDNIEPDAPMCATGKRPFRTEEAARDQLAQARGRRANYAGQKPGRVETAVYQCPSCQWWHLTANPRR
jgi:hypothetical protein